MSPGLATESIASTPVDWRPSADIAALRGRAAMLAAVRDYFRAQGVLEVETPILASATTPDPNIDSVALEIDGEPLYLQTSPEFAMKRLLAAGSGSVYQIGRAVRAGERGRWHQREFTMLEWYRVGFDHHALMDDVAALLVRLGIAAAGEIERVTYREAFRTGAGVDPFEADLASLHLCAEGHGLALPEDLDRDAVCDALVGCVVGPGLGLEAPQFLFDYPHTQAALARVRHEDPPVASRFELYWRGCELANGFHELGDAAEQRRRFEAERARRAELGLHCPPLDEALLAALAAGLPECAGVALGIDRLLAISLGHDGIAPALAFAHG